MSMLEDLLQSAGVEVLNHNVGGGGSAVVHKCRVAAPSPRLPEAGMLLAAKEYRAEILSGTNQRRRIRQEGDLGSKLQHPNVIRTFGLLGEESFDGASPPSVVLLLEWIEGQNLDEWYHARHKSLTWDDVRSIAIGLASAVSELHKSGVFHRDIKPENARVREDNGTVVLMDIGVAELSSSDDTTMHTSVKDFVGSARYASPQFILGNEPFSAADDIYSLGATFFLLMTGQMIYAEVERKSVLPIAVVQDPPQLRSLAENIPATMKVLLQGMLHREPKRRPSIDEVIDSLNNPEGAKYLTDEFARQTEDIRSYEILEVVDRGSCFADLAGDTPKLDEEYTVVRPHARALQVPSYNRKVVPEVWVGEATLKHIHGNVGYFHLHRKRWHEGSSPFSSFNIPRGQWIHEEGNNLSVLKGDRILRKST
ncbi:MAG: serine/threonine protein kinase [Gemmatimonas sp.]